MTDGATSDFSTIFISGLEMPGSSPGMTGVVVCKSGDVRAWRACCGAVGSPAQPLPHRLQPAQGVLDLRHALGQFLAAFLGFLDHFRRGLGREAGVVQPALDGRDVQSSSVMKGMNGCSRTRIWSMTHATMAGSRPSPSTSSPFRIGLDQLQIPVAELAPDELVDRVGRVVEAVAFDRLGRPPSPSALSHLRSTGSPAASPAAGRSPPRGRTVHLGEAGRVPELGAEIAIALDAGPGELDVTALARPSRPA
jgi:hypothetical protein